MTKSTRTVLVLIDRTEDDEQVVREALGLVPSADSTIALLHIARPVGYSVRRGSLAAPSIEPWEQMRATESSARHRLRELAIKLPPGARVETLLRFGDPVEEAARVASSLGASCVVAHSRPARWLPWRSRDRRLTQALGIPVVLVNAVMNRRQPRPHAAEHAFGASS